MAPMGAAGLGSHSTVGRPWARHHSHHGGPTASAELDVPHRRIRPHGIGLGHQGVGAGWLWGCSCPCPAEPGLQPSPGAPRAGSRGCAQSPGAPRSYSRAGSSSRPDPGRVPGTQPRLGSACAPVPVPAPMSCAAGLPAPAAAAATAGPAQPLLPRQLPPPRPRGRAGPRPTQPALIPDSADHHWCRSLPVPIAAGSPTPLPPWHRASRTPCTSHPWALPGQLSLISPFPPSGTAPVPSPCRRPLRGASCCPSRGPSPGCCPAGGQTAASVHPLAPRRRPTGSHPELNSCWVWPDLRLPLVGVTSLPPSWVRAGIRLQPQCQRVPTGPAAPVELAPLSDREGLPMAAPGPMCGDTGMQGRGAVGMAILVPGSGRQPLARRWWSPGAGRPSASPGRRPRAEQRRCGHVAWVH